MDDPVSYMVEQLRRRGIPNEVTRQVAAAVRREFGGSQIYIRRLDRDGRDAEIKAALARGLSPEEAARQAKTSVSTIRRRRSSWL